MSHLSHRCTRQSIVSLAMAILFSSGLAADEFFLKDARRVVFLGDSNTFAGGFIADIDAYLIARFPERKYELINLGLPSETCTGLSEADHPYPRPDINTRIDRALAETKPEVVVICYGMNDGIYSPFTEGHFKKYQEGIRGLIAKAKKAGAKAVLTTPSPFDPLPVKDKLLPAGAPKYSWMRPFEDYDGVLARYSEWLVSLRKEGYLVADPHTSINRHLAEKRKTDPAYRVSGDGIHPNAIGQRIVAEELLRVWQAPRPVDLASLSNNPEFWRLINERERLLGLAWLTHVGHKRPDTPKGISLEEAQKKAAVLKARIRKIATEKR